MLVLYFKSKNTLYFLLFLFLISFDVNAQDNFKELKGKVIDGTTKKALPYVSIGIGNSNIATVTNDEGEFLLKVPEHYKDTSVMFNLLGYKTRQLLVSEVEQDTNIELFFETTALSQVDISVYKNAKNLVEEVFAKTPQNNSNKVVLMTAFYRETIKKRKKNVSLTEAVVNLYKQSYTNGSRDIVSLRKARKSTDYRRLDTVAVKLVGGPFSTLFLDVMKYPKYVFSKETILDYDFSFSKPSIVNDMPVHVVNF